VTDIGLQDVFSPTTRATDKMMTLLKEDTVSQITVDSYDRVIFIDHKGPQFADRMFATPGEYLEFCNHLLRITDAGVRDIHGCEMSVIEGSFNPDLTNVHGSIHILTSELTGGEPALTIRKQPLTVLTLDQMLSQAMMNTDMRLFLEQAVRGRSNILVSGGSGAGKTTLARALSMFVDPWHRVVTCEEIDELHLRDRLHDVVRTTTFRKRDERGCLLREVTLDDLVRESLRMRPDRVWVGETRGKEAYALVKAANSGHDGCVTTLHADNGKQAIKQLITYVMESGLPETVARQQVAQAFHIVVQVSKLRMQRRVITEISYLEPVIENHTEQRITPLWKYNPETDTHEKTMISPPKRLMEHWSNHGVNYDPSPHPQHL